MSFELLGFHLSEPLARYSELHDAVFIERVLSLGLSRSCEKVEGLYPVSHLYFLGDGHLLSSLP